MKYLARILIVIGLYLTITPAFVYASSYYVSTSGNDGNNGSIISPWKTIQKAANTMVAGDTVNIHAGIYNEMVVPAHSGNANSYITYRDFGDGDVIINGEGGVRTNSIRVSNQAYLQFINLRLRNTGYGGQNAGFAAYAGSHHLIIDGVTSEFNRFGILLKGNKTSSEDTSNVVGFVTIKNSTVRNNSAYGVFVYYKVIDTVIGPNNVIYNENDKNGVPIDDQYGIDIDTDYPGDPANGPRRITVIGNEIYGNRIQGIRPWNGWNILIKDNYVHHNGASGIQVEDGCQNVVVVGNRSEYNSQGYEYETGIWIDSTSKAVVENNILRGNQIGLMVTDSNNLILRNNQIFQNSRAFTGSNIMGTVLNRNSSDIMFVHNTLWKNGVSGSRGNLMYCSQPITNTVLKNNIFSESAGSNDAWINCAITSDYNNFFNNQSLSIYYSGGNRTWANYVSLSNQDHNSITSNPLLNNPGSGDFSLSGSSPDIDRGSFLTYTTSSGSGTTIPLSDSRYFTDGMGVVSGDDIRVGSNLVKVVGVDYNNNNITVNKSITWSSNDPVSYLYSGNKPDIGAIEYGSSVSPTPTPTPTPTPANKPGDANGDGLVNETDYGIWKNNYNQNLSGPTNGDFDNDGLVDGADYIIWLNNYGK